MSSKSIAILFLFLFSVIHAQAQEIVDEYNYNQNIELTNQGWEHIRSKNYNEAIENFTQAIKLYDGNTDSFSGIATAYFKTDKYDSASYFVKKAMSISPNEADLHYLAGNIYMKDQGFTDAINEYSMAFSLNSTSEIKIDLANCYFNRGTAYLFSEKYNEALSDFNKTLKLKSFANAYHNRGITYRHLFKKQEACNNFHTAVIMGSKQSDFYVKGYCKDVKMKALNTNLKNEGEKTSIDNIDQITEKSDTIKVTLYYTNSWILTNDINQMGKREASLRVSDKKFVGSFFDYYPSGNIVVKGQYDSNGKKTGLFERFYDNGNPYSIGEYKDDEQIGNWKYYYPNGNFHEEISFEENSFSVLEYHDEFGKVLVDNGTGEWTRVFPVSNYERYILTAPFELGKRTGKWKLKNKNNQLFLVESYDNGVFQSGKTGTPGNMKKLETSQFTAALFYPISYTNIENFEFHHTATREDYPFLEHLPTAKIPVIDVFLDVDQDKLETFEPVDVKPAPPVGMAGFYKYVGRNLIYPNEARRKGIQGKVYVQFIVDTDGKLTEVKTVQGIGGGCDEEAEKVVRLAPPWSPGLQKGRPVKVRMIVPITFKIG